MPVGPPVASTSLKQLLNIFPKQVRFQIHRVTNFSFTQDRDRQCVRNNPNAETFFINAGDRKADAVNRNRTFQNHITQHARRRGDFEDVIRARIFPSERIFPTPSTWPVTKMPA